MKVERETIWAYHQNHWKVELSDLRIQSLQQYLETDLDGASLSVFKLSDLTCQALAGMTLIESAAFAMPMGESLVDSFTHGKNYTVLLAGFNSVPVGFLTLDNSLEKEGICYIDIATVIMPGKGIGKLLHQQLIKLILKTDSKSPMVLARTQNPAEIVSMAKAANEIGCALFPIDRSPSQNEQKGIRRIIEAGMVRILSTRQQLDIEKCIFFHAYERWKPLSPSIQPGIFYDYLQREHLNYADFCLAGNAFIIGSTLSSGSSSHLG